jgi:hypothetical protein
MGDQGSVERFINERVMAGYFILFRSPRFADLPRRKESVDFARGLWRDILTRWQPRLLMTIDTEAFGSLRDILVKEQGVRQDSHHRFNTGWGNYQAEAVRLSMPDGNNMTLARLPHLSTFKLFRRDACRPYLETFLSYVTQAA